MKISKLFHTLYAFLMFLPVMVLPLFAININQKEVEPLTAQIEEIELVNFNQLYIHDSSESVANDITFNFDQYNISVNGSANGSSGFNFYNLNYDYLGHKVYFKFSNYYNNGTSCQLYTNFAYNQYITLSSNNPSTILDINYPLGLIVNYATNNTYDYGFTFNLIDLTIMFGSGNEPTMQQFDIWYPHDYYQYTLSDKQILHTGVQNTLNNTDVGSQFLYSLYNPLKDYFNLPNYMNLGGLYDWFLVNLFSGYNSPLYFIIFDLMIYWLAMSLLWLIFDVLMYVPSMIHKMLDKARME